MERGMEYVRREIRTNQQQFQENLNAGMEYVRREIRTNQHQIQENLNAMKYLCLRVVETALRLPGLILLELWWRNRDMSFDEITQEMLNKAPFNSYMDISTILDFVHRRNFDQSAGHILSYSVLFLSVLFLTLPLSKLIRMYAHFVSIVIYAFGHYMSTIYVRLEVESKEQELKLDDFVKLERHGFHFLAQLMLALLQSFVLGLESDIARLFLTQFTIPIIARMCACPLDKLIVAHNVACCLTMFSMCIYSLNRVPAMAQYLKNAFLQLKAILVVRGLASGAVTVWRRLRIAELLTCAWMTIFVVRMYVEIYEKGRPFHEVGPVLLASIAESTNTPLSLLALALTVSFVCKWVVDGAQLAVGGTRDHGHVLAHSGYTEALTLVLLCAQTGLLGMKTEQKAFLLGLVLFIVFSALLQSLYELFEPQLLSLAASPGVSRGRHIRCLILAAFLIISPVGMSTAITAFLPIDLWCVIIVSNCVLTTIHSASTTIIYCIGIVEARAPEPWERGDDLVFACKTVTKFIELFIAFAVLVYGVYSTIVDSWTLASIAVLAFHVVVNIYKRFLSLIESLKARRDALKNLASLPKATEQQLSDRSDVCAICFTDMVSEARMTPCAHFFHGACLRKWLAVKQVCPLCYAEIKSADEKLKEDEQIPSPNERGPLWREQHRMDGARDMWPLINGSMDGGSDYDSEDSTHTEFTLPSSDNDN